MNGTKPFSGKPFSGAMKLQRIFSELNVSQTGLLDWAEFRELAARRGEVPLPPPAPPTHTHPPSCHGA